VSKLILKGANVVWTGTVGRGGHIMYALQWLHGLRLLGHEVLYYDRGSDSREAAALFGTIMERWWDIRLAAAIGPKDNRCSALRLLMAVLAPKLHGTGYDGGRVPRYSGFFTTHIRSRKFSMAYALDT
jgi:hypothetical protein